MEYAIAPKVYDIDYSFIIKNYLSPDLWNKTWTLFVYKDFKATLELKCIHTQQPIKIEFRISANNKNHNDSNTITYDMTNSNLTILKNQINGAIRDCINWIEKYSLLDTSEYCRIREIASQEEDRLREIAEGYLNDNGIYLEDVREAYIDRYISNNLSLDCKASKYCDNNKYKYLTELWLVFYKCIGNDDKYQTILNINNDNSELNEILEEISKFERMFDDDSSSEYEEWYDAKYDSLEAIC